MKISMYSTISQTGTIGAFSPIRVPLLRRKLLTGYRYKTQFRKLTSFICKHQNLDNEIFFKQNGCFSFFSFHFHQINTKFVFLKIIREFRSSIPKVSGSGSKCTVICTFKHGSVQLIG